MRVLLLSAAVAAAASFGAPAFAAFAVPDSLTSPFEDWTRGDADSGYAEYDVFTAAYAAPNTPDVGSAGPGAGSTVVQTADPAAFLISGSGNIYSFAGATGFDVAMPDYGYGAGYNTRVVLQIGSLGTPIDPGTLDLTYNNGATDVTVTPDYVEDKGADADTGHSEWLVVWDIASYNPASSLISFAAAGSSMSLATLAVDTFTQTDAFSALPAIPEPASALTFAALGMIAFGCRRGSND